MTKQEYKQAMNKIKWANKKKGEKWGKKEMGIAQEMAMKLKTPTPNQENSGNSTWKGSSQPTNLQSVLGDLTKIIKSGK